MSNFEITRAKKKLETSDLVITNAQNGEKKGCRTKRDERLVEARKQKRRYENTMPTRLKKYKIRTAERTNCLEKTTTVSRVDSK